MCASLQRVTNCLGRPNGKSTLSNGCSYSSRHWTQQIDLERYAVNVEVSPPASSASIGYESPSPYRLSPVGLRITAASLRNNRVESPAVALAPGTRLGPYEVAARSAPAAWARCIARATRGSIAPSRSRCCRCASPSIPQLRERFEREAGRIAALNHPHICTLYDVGEDDGAPHFLVMEMLEGETLAARLARGALPLDQALRHRDPDRRRARHGASRGHRPSRPQARQHHADEGGREAARLRPRQSASARRSPVADCSMLPTTPPNLTAQGTILGTFQYMAPEQLEGREADARTDIFAFGAVLYEMVTGKKAFEGKSQASLIGAILERDPAPVSTLQPLAPPALDRVVAACLAKDPDERWQSGRRSGRAS